MNFIIHFNKAKLIDRMSSNYDLSKIELERESRNPTKVGNKLPILKNEKL